MEKREAVAEIGLFKGLTREQLVKLADIAYVKAYEKGMEIIRAGDQARGFFAVITGSVKVFRSGLNGKEQIMHVFGPGEPFAEVPVFEGSTYPVSAQALEPSRLLVFDRDKLKKLIAGDPELALGMLGLMAARLRGFVRQVAELSLKEVPSRLAAYLLLLRSGLDSDTVELALPKGQIAAYLGTIQETLSRAFKRLSDEGMIQLNGKHITLLDTTKLELLAEGNA